MTIEKIMHQLKQYQRTGEAPEFHGHEPFEILLQQGRIKPGTEIKLLSGDYSQELFMVNLCGDLEIMTSGEPPYKPHLTLNQKNSPGGWQIVKF
ncbi:MAG: hypothetical protein KJ597_02615 [Nanoarchaeota archaeon]|nr:hypothetical protein [Nanoarchaeota archaeon]MBU1622443.1 hypothetical protein [Nanoarchaeota archaeon]